MAKVIIKRFLPVLLCVIVFLYSFAFTSFCVNASNVDLISDLYDFAKNLIDDGFMPGTTDSNGVHFDASDFDMFQQLMTDVHYPSGGEFVSANNEHKGVHIIPTHSMPFFCQPYVVSHGDYYFASSGILFTNDGFGRCNSDQSSVEAFTCNYLLNMSYYNLVCSVPSQSSQVFSSYVYSYNDPTLYSNFSPMSGGYSPTSFGGSGFQSLSLIYIDYNDITDFGYVIGAVDDIFSVPPGLASMPDNATFNVPKGALTLSQLTYTVGDDTYTADGDPIGDPVGDDTDNTSGSLGGDITVGGKIEVGGKVDVDVNVNVNGGGTGNSYEMPDTGFFEGYLDNALDESSGIRKFIGDFFGTLPGQITTLICIGLVLAILSRIIGR